VDYSEDIRNARLDAVETVLGASPRLRIRTGAKPGNVAAASTGTVLAEAVLPADWMNAAAGGVKTKSGVWGDAAADAAGTAAHFELATNAGVVKVRGTISAPGGGGEMILDNVVLAVGQAFTVSDFTLTAGNAGV
jgi:hypothetical protein